MSLLYNSLSLLLLAATTTNALQLFNDPASYFGGTDHQAYLDWVDTISSNYDASTYLPSIDPTQGAAIHWRIVDDEWLNVAVAARSVGWIAFGLSEAGGMLGSDMALFEAKNPTVIVDAHVVDSFQPQSDDCQQDWILVDDSTVGATTKQAALDAEGEGFLMFQARRKLDTGDPQDKRIVNDSDATITAHRVIAAWGDSDSVSYHGTNVARGAIRFYDPEDPTDFFLQSMDNAEGTYIVGASNYTIPAIDTEYATFCVSRADLLKQGVPDQNDYMNIIGYRPVISPQSAAHVHHFVVHGYNDPDAACDDDDDGANVIYVWAPGDMPFALPDFLGAPMFGPDGYQSFSIEIHYDNPRLQSGVVDSSGVEFYYTSQPRDMEMGVLELGDPFVALTGTAVGDGFSLHSFTCPGNCSSLFLQQNDGDDESASGAGVTVIREYLHMHQVGTRITNELVRNGQVIRQGAVEVWDFEQNGNAAVQQEPYQILPGDQFRLSCYYRTTAQDKTLFGLGSRDEMCIAFLYYYPRKSFKVDDGAGGVFELPWVCAHGLDDFVPPCATSYAVTPLEESNLLNRAFGEPQCQADDSDSGHETVEPNEGDQDDVAQETDGAASTSGVLPIGGVLASPTVVAAIVGVFLVASSM